MINTNENINSCNNTFTTNQFGIRVNSQNECHESCSHTERINSYQYASINDKRANCETANKNEKALINNKEHKLEVSSKNISKKYLSNRLHYKIENCSEVNEYRENSENEDDRDQNSRLTAPFSTDLKSVENISDLPKEINEVKCNNLLDLHNIQINSKIDKMSNSESLVDLIHKNNQKSIEMLIKLRSMVSDNLANTKSKQRTSFITTAEKTISNYKRKKINEVLFIRYPLKNF